MKQPPWYTTYHQTTVRRVWAAITQTPTASNRELAHRLRMSYATVNGCLLQLRDAGYVTWQPRSERARRVVVPFVEVAG